MEVRAGEHPGLVLRRWLAPSLSWPGAALAFGQGRGRQPISAREEIIGIQYLRGLAALAVVACHMGDAPGLADPFGPVAGSVLLVARVGVDLFFVLSGFIITVVSLDGPGLVPAIGRRDFFLRRFARIVPLMWVAILLDMAMNARAGGLAEWPSYLHALLLLPVGEVRPVLVWTLRLELIFYAIFAVAMLGRVRRGWILWGWAVSGWIVTFLIFAAARHGWIAPGAMASAWMSSVLLVFYKWSAEFGVGVLVGMLWLRRGGSQGWRLPVEPLVLLALLFVIAILCFWLTAKAVPVAPFGLMAVFGAMVWLAANAECPPGIAQRIGLALGNASYSIYLFHLAALSLVLALARRLAPGAPPWLVAILCAVAGIALGIAVHRWLEKPLVRAARRWLGIGRTRLGSVPDAGSGAGSGTG